MGESSLALAALGIGVVAGSIANLVVMNIGDTIFQTTKNLMVVGLGIQEFFDNASKEAQEEYAKKTGESLARVTKESHQIDQEAQDTVEVASDL